MIVDYEVENDELGAQPYMFESQWSSESIDEETKDNHFIRAGNTDLCVLTDI